MNFKEMFVEKRTKLMSALVDAGITEILKTRFKIPTEYPAGIVVLKEEKGEHKTARRYTLTKIKFEVYLVVSKIDDSDPDKTIYDLKEDFREEFVRKQGFAGKDFEFVEYYDSKAKGTKDVKIARIEVEV